MADRALEVRPIARDDARRGGVPVYRRAASPPEPRLAGLTRMANEGRHLAAPRTGLPDGLKTAIETLSGLTMGDVRVHRGSAHPAQLGALAYARGTHIHLAPGQERHLPHEAWHVVQQKQGRVAATARMGGIGINADAALEAEADRMGDRAARLAAGPDASAVDRMGAAASTVGGVAGDGIAQCVFATVNPQNGPVPLQQVGGGGAFVIMQNPGQPAGVGVNNTVGFTGVINPDSWAGLAKATASNYWRAHAYAESFGGSGGPDNVGWWRETEESEWTGFEQQVRGAGLAQIPAWLPGIGEAGTYLVERDMHPAVVFKHRYVDPLVAAMHWGFDDARPAWARALASCASHNSKEREKREALLRTEKAGVRANIQTRVQTWIDTLFGTTNLETNFIRRMKMTYTITAPGAAAGPDRTAFSHSTSSPLPQALAFGLDTTRPAQLWVELVDHNVGMFAQGAPPITLLGGAVAYDDLRRPAQQFAAYADGWGVA